jgi:hypothetical protein
MAEFPWCTSNKQSIEDREAAKEALYEELESIHGEISGAEWGDIVEPMHLADHAGLSDFTTRPDDATTGAWWDLKTPVEPWIEVKMFVSTDSEASLNQDILNDATTALEFTFKGDAASTNVKRIEISDGARLVTDSRYKVRSAVEKYKAAIESNQLPDLAAIVSDIEAKLNDLKGHLEKFPGNADNNETRAYREQYVEFVSSGFIASVDSLVSNNSKYFDALGADTVEKCPTKEDIRQFYQNALLLMAAPEIVSKDNEEWWNDVANLALGVATKNLSSILDSIEEFGEEAGRIKDAIEKEVKKQLNDAFANEIVFSEQCFMLSNLYKFVEARKDQDELAGLPYALDNYTTPELLDRLENSAQLKSYIDSNKPINIQGDPFPFINKLTVNSNQAALFDLREEQLSAFTPRIRLFKSEFNPKTFKEEEIEIKFDAHAGVEVKEFMKNKGRGGRGLGVGVKSFSFSYDGTDPFSAKKAISAKLDLYAPSFSDLLKDRIGTVVGGGSQKTYKYVDLALKTGGNLTESKKKKLTQVQLENADKLNFRIRVLVEFAASKDVLRTFRNEQSRYSGVLKNAVYDSAISIYLTPTIHQFNFDEAGGVEFSIDYLAYIEDYFSQSNFDIFTENSKLRKARDQVLQYFKEQNCDKKDGYDKFKEEDQQFVERANLQSLNSVVRELFLSQKIYFISLTDQSLREFLNNPYSIGKIKLKKQSLAELEKDATEIMSSVLNEAGGGSYEEVEDEPTAADKKREIVASLVAHSENTRKISFVYVNDIISIVMKMIDDSLKKDDGNLAASDMNIGKYINEIAASLASTEELNKAVKTDPVEKLKAARTYQAYKQMRVVLGPAEIGMSENKYVQCCIGDIPISLNYFIDFLTEKVLSKNLSSYPLSKFIKDLINDCVKNFVNDDTCYKVNIGERLQLNSTTVLAYDVRENSYTEDNLSDLIASTMRVKKDGEPVATREVLMLDKINPKAFPLLSISGPRGPDPRTFLKIDKMRNYYIFSASRKYPANSYVGDRAIDAKNGIFHYILGEDRGMMKTISLDRTNTPGLKELRFEQEGYAGLEQLREVYNANITTFLNVQSFPGTYIYVEPNGFDPTATEDLSRFGVGGYYMITKTRHTIQPGNAETEINAAWIASKGTYIRNEKEGSEEEKQGEERQKKCAIEFRS